MFFSISKQTKENFPNQYRLGEFVVNTDNGWHTYSYGEWAVVHKGYADHASLALLLKDIINQDLPTYTGNFCAIVYSNITNKIQIKSNKYRSFPLYYDQDQEVTNLVPLSTTVYSDNIIEIDKNIHVEYPRKSNFDVIGSIDTSPLTFTQALDHVDLILSQRTESFLKHNTLPIKVHLSGGVDSLLVYSYLQKYTDHYEMVRAKHFDYDYFYLTNEKEIESYWGYKQIHHWREPCVLTSGAPGDEFMLRSPITCDMFLKHRGIQVTEILETDTWKNCLHYSYFKKPNNYTIFENQVVPESTDTEIIQRMCNTVINDWQHWHIGNTLTWTPLRDIEIFKTILRMSVNDCLGQIMNSNFSQALIERNRPGLSQVISDQKNSGNCMKNLCEFLSL